MIQVFEFFLQVVGAEQGRGEGVSGRGPELLGVYRPPDPPMAPALSILRPCPCGLPAKEVIMIAVKFFAAASTANSAKI